MSKFNNFDWHLIWFLIIIFSVLVFLIVVSCNLEDSSQDEAKDKTDSSYKYKTQMYLHANGSLKVYPDYSKGVPIPISF